MKYLQLTPSVPGLTFPLPLFSTFPYPFSHPYSIFFIPWVHLKKTPPSSSHWPNGKPGLTSKNWPDRKLGSTSNYWNTKRRFGSPTSHWSNRKMPYEVIA